MGKDSAHDGTYQKKKGKRKAPLFPYTRSRKCLSLFLLRKEEGERISED